MTPDNDPGSAAAGASRPRVGRGGAARAGRRRPDPRRHRLVDGPDDDRGRRVLPERRGQRRGPAPVLRLDVPGRRGRLDVLLAAGRADVAGSGSTGRHRLHVRHQGPRADDRAGDGDEAPAPSRSARLSEQQAKSRIYAKDLPASRTRSGGCSATASPRSPSAASSGRSCSSTRSGSSRRTRTAPSSRKAVERLDGWKVAVEFRNGHGSTRRTPSGPARFLAERNIPFVMVDEPQGFKSSVPAQTLVTSSDLALVGSTAATPTWEKKGITPAERFPLPLLAGRALGVGAADPRAERGPRVHLMFNNCYANYGTTNAREIALLLAELGCGARTEEGDALRLRPAIPPAAPRRAPRVPRRPARSATRPSCPGRAA